MSEPQPIEFDPKLAAAIFNRLEWLQKEGHHDNQPFYADRVLWGVLTSMGVAIDMTEVETHRYYFGSMLDGSFHEMESTDVEWLIEHYGKGVAQ
jgi:hypothetical protein